MDLKQHPTHRLMTVLMLFGTAWLPATFSSGADAPDKKVLRVEAVVQKFERAAMHDSFDDGRFAVYDGVSLKVTSPARLAGKTIRVFFPSGSVAAESPMRRIGERCRFDLDESRLEADVLFGGALENLKWIRAGGHHRSPCSFLHSPLAGERGFE